MRFLAVLLSSVVRRGAQQRVRSDRGHECATVAVPPRSRVCVDYVSVYVCGRTTMVPCVCRLRMYVPLCLFGPPGNPTRLLGPERRVRCAVLTSYFAALLLVLINTLAVMPGHSVLDCELLFECLWC